MFHLDFGKSYDKPMIAYLLECSLQHNGQIAQLKLSTALHFLRSLNLIHDAVTYHVQDYAAAIENMLLMIEDLGYATCWVEGQVTGPDKVGRKMAEILGVPEEYDLVCMLPIGVAAEECKRREKLPFEERAWFNHFGGEK